MDLKDSPRLTEDFASWLGRDSTADTPKIGQSLYTEGFEHGMESRFISTLGPLYGLKGMYSVCVLGEIISLHRKYPLLMHVWQTSEFSSNVQLHVPLFAMHIKYVKSYVHTHAQHLNLIFRAHTL